MQAPNVISKWPNSSAKIFITIWYRWYHIDHFELYLRRKSFSVRHEMSDWSAKPWLRSRLNLSWRFSSDPGESDLEKRTILGQNLLVQAWRRFQYSHQPERFLITLELFSFCLPYRPVALFTRRKMFWPVDSSRFAYEVICALVQF